VVWIIEGFPVISSEDMDQNAINTLRFYPGECINYRMCLEACPYQVFG
jgi:hypothetical protein